MLQKVFTELSQLICACCVVVRSLSHAVHEPGIALFGISRTSVKHHSLACETRLRIAGDDAQTMITHHSVMSIVQ